MNQAKIDKLIELAFRGEGGEMDNARSILAKHGIDWRVKRPVTENVKSFFGMNTTKEWRTQIKYASDMVLMATLLRKIGKSDKVSVQGNYLIFSCSESEAEAIGRNFYRIRDDFDTCLQKIAHQFLEI